MPDALSSVNDDSRAVRYVPASPERWAGRITGRSERRGGLTGHRRTALSSRELEVLRLSSEGRSVKQIAYELEVSHSTITTLLDRARGKLGAVGKTHAVAIAIRQGLV